MSTEWPENLPLYVRWCNGEVVLYKTADPHVEKDGRLFCEVYNRWRKAAAAERLATAGTLYLAECSNHGHRSEEALAAHDKWLEALGAFEKAGK